MFAVLKGTTITKYIITNNTYYMRLHYKCNWSNVQKPFVRWEFARIRHKYSTRDVQKVRVYENYALERQAVPATSIYIITGLTFGNC